MSWFEGDYPYKVSQSTKHMKEFEGGYKTAVLNLINYSRWHCDCGNSLVFLEGLKKNMEYWAGDERDALTGSKDYYSNIFSVRGSEGYVRCCGALCGYRDIIGYLDGFIESEKRSPLKVKVK